jgi:hypothetical protein
MAGFGAQQADKKAKTKALAKRATSAIANWDEELAKQAEAAAAQEANTGGGQFFSLRGGQLKLNDAPLPNNEIAAVIIDSVLENVYYAGDFDPDNPASPSCYAFGRDEDSMEPNEAVEEKQADGCADCPMNQWGSAETGRGKACRNRRRIAVIPAGTIDRNGEFEAYDDPDHFAKAQVAYLALPPTSINGYGAWVKQVAGALKRPPHAVFARIAVVPDQKTQLKVTFETLGPVPNELLPAVIKRHDEVAANIEFPYQKVERQDPKAKRKAKPRKY